MIRASFAGVSAWPGTNVQDASIRIGGEEEMARKIKVAAAQLGPIHLADGRARVVRRLCALLREAHGMGGEARGVSRARADHLLPALLVRRHPRDRRLVRARDAERRDRAPVRSRPRLRRRLLSRLRRARPRRRRRPPLQHLDPGRPRRPDHRQVPEGASARPRRPPRGHSLPASGKALLRGRQSRLPGLAGVRGRWSAC